MTCRLTWAVVLQDVTIHAIQEPISEMYVSKEEFNEAYQPFLDTLNGRDCTSFVDFFWRRSPANTSCLEFVDRDA
jgi:hypothetical protein